MESALRVTRPRNGHGLPICRVVAPILTVGQQPLQKDEARGTGMEEPASFEHHIQQGRQGFARRREFSRAE